MKLMQFWSEEKSLTTLLVLLGVNMFVLDPVIREWGGIALMRSIFFSLLLLDGLQTMTRHKTLRLVFIVFVALTLVVHWARVGLGTSGLLGWDALLSLLSVCALTMIVLFQVNRKGPVTGHRIRGAIAGYLLLGMAFACAYALIENVIPHSFQIPTGEFQSAGAQFDAFSYFSVVTLTTLGYGDITAILPVARSAVMIEALLGQLYPAILIARLVTLQIGAPKEE
jgi:hypothetical protein